MPEKYSKKKSSEQNFQRLHAPTPVKIVRLDDAFSEFFELEASPVEGQSPRKKERTAKRKGEKKI